MTQLAHEAELELFRRNAVDLVELRDLGLRLQKARAEKRPLRVKFGMDPSSPDLHVGHAVQLMKLRALQELGHRIVLIVGDSTAMVGDPSGRNKLRPQLSRADVEANLVTYTSQAGKVLDMSKTEVHKNSEWFDAMRFEDVLKLAGKATVARMLERDTFEKRMEAKEPIGVHEFLYPLMQGWDSVMIRCDVELGGTDQLFNLLVGRDLQEKESQAPQICMTLPLINGLDGRKMSKSYGNAIAFTDTPNDMFGKVMSIPDEVMGEWFRLLTQLEEAEIASVLSGSHRDAKARLGEEIASFFHGRVAGRAAREAFDRQFRDKQVPTDIPDARWPDYIAASVAGPNVPLDMLALSVLLREIGLCASSSEARRLIEGGGVKLDGVLITDPNHAIARPTNPIVIQAGKRRFARLVPPT